MGYRIRMVPEVAGWLGQLRDADPGTAGVVDDALAALRDQGASLGPPLVIPVEVRPELARPDLDQAYQRQLEMLTRLRRAVAEMATARKRLELQIHQQEQAVRILFTVELSSSGTEPSCSPPGPNATGWTPGTRRRYANPGPGTGGTRVVQANVEECLTISG